MYAEYYALSSIPFQLTPDSRFFFGSSEHTKAMAFLNYGISQGEGFVVVTGEVGAGKTTLVEHLLSMLDPRRYVSARVVTTQLNNYDMLRMVGAGFQLFREGMDKASLLTRIKQFLSDLHGRQQRALLVIDEAQSLPTDALEELRMLSNILVAGAAPLQSILLGQPEFRATLSRPELEQVRQRVTASCHLGPLNAADTRLYIEHRLKRAGWKGDPGFSDQAFGEIYRFTGGIPRRINTLCSRILLLGFLEGKHRIDRETVVSVGSELSAEVGPLQGALPRLPQDSLATETVSNPTAEIFELPEFAIPAASGEREVVQDFGGRGDVVARDELMPRIEKLEQKLERQERSLSRALDIAVRHLGGLKP